MQLFLLTLQLNPFLHTQPANPDLGELASVLWLHTKTNTKDMKPGQVRASESNMTADI